MRSTNKTNRRTVFWCVALAIVWALIPFTGLFSTDATATASQCPNAPLAADLSGGATNASNASGRAMFREKGSNRLMVNIRGATANASLDVYVGDTKVGTITVGRGGSGQLRVDSPTATIDEGTAISVRNGTMTVMSGTFQCVAGGPNASPTASPTTSPTASPTTSPTVMPTVSPTTSPTASPTMQPRT